MIINDDCLFAMNNISDSSVDMILCDLPYVTTRVSAHNLNRKFIDTEKEEKYFNIIKERLEL